MQPSVRVEGLVKRYGAREALRGVSFRVEAGEVVALLGPNGAGKTTTVEILEGYRTRDGGRRGGARRSIPAAAGARCASASASSCRARPRTRT